MTRTPLDVGAVVGSSRSSRSRLSCILRSSQSASERNHCSACARGSWAPTTGSVFTNPVNVLCRSLGSNRPSTYRRASIALIALAKQSIKVFHILFQGCWGSCYFDAFCHLLLCLLCPHSTLFFPSSTKYPYSDV